jgi:hypothetical protein
MFYIGGMAEDSRLFSSLRAPFPEPIVASRKKRVSMSGSSGMSGMSGSQARAPHGAACAKLKLGSGSPAREQGE